MALVPAETTLAVYGKVTSPAAGQVITSIGAQPSGYVYNIVVTLYTMGSATAAVDDSNMQGVLPAGNQQYLCPVYTLVTYNLYSTSLASGMQVKAIAAGSSGAIYEASIIATPLGTG
jgi:hypothetical protein